MPCMLEFKTGGKAPYDVIFINAKCIETVRVHIGQPDQTEITYGNNGYEVVHEKCADVVAKLRFAFEVGEA